MYPYGFMTQFHLLQLTKSEKMNLSKQIAISCLTLSDRSYFFRRVAVEGTEYSDH